MKKLLQVSEHVWIMPPQWRYAEPTIGFALTDEGVVVIDSGNSPDHARRALDALRQVTDLPIRYVINTHRHWDHVFGNQVLEAPVIAHEFCKRKMLANLRDDWAPDQIIHWVTGWVLPRVPTLKAEQFDRLHLVLPQITFTGKLELELGTVKFNVLYAGGGHTHDSIMISLPTEKIVFLSDCLYPNPEGRISNLVRLLARIERLKAEKLISGHEMPSNFDQFALRRDYYHQLMKTARKLHRRKDRLQEITLAKLAPRFAQINGLNEVLHQELLARACQELVLGEKGF